MLAFRDTAVKGNGHLVIDLQQFACLSC